MGKIVNSIGLILYQTRAHKELAHPLSRTRLLWTLSQLFVCSGKLTSGVRNFSINPLNHLLNFLNSSSKKSKIKEDSKGITHLKAIIGYHKFSGSICLCALYSSTQSVPFPLFYFLFIPENFMCPTTVYAYIQKTSAYSFWRDFKKK